jgi:hypothetical protein
MLSYIISNPDHILTVATSVVTIASIVTTATDTPAPETLLGKMYKILEVLALVIGKTKQ